LIRTPKNDFEEGSKLPRQPKQEVQETIKNTFSEDLNLYPLFPMEPDLSLYQDCSELPYPCPICNPPNCAGVVLTVSLEFLEFFFSEHQISEVKYLQDLHREPDSWQGEHPGGA